VSVSSIRVIDALVERVIAADSRDPAKGPELRVPTAAAQGSAIPPTFCDPFMAAARDGEKRPQRISRRAREAEPLYDDNEIEIIHTFEVVVNRRFRRQPDLYR
jgi:hypothetical protein